MKIPSIVLLAVIALTACAKTDSQLNQITDVYVEDFGSTDIKTCRPSDVDLSNTEVKDYFLRAREVEHKVVQDHYNFAPCHIEGTLKQNSTACEWEIRAGATGHIKCNGVTKYFVCDTCDDLFTSKTSPQT